MPRGGHGGTQPSQIAVSHSPNPIPHSEQDLLAQALQEIEAFVRNFIQNPFLQLLRGHKKKKTQRERGGGMKEKKRIETEL